MKKIIHIDMDAFYASVEQRDNPQYRGKPLVVAEKAKRSVVSAASYEARAYGIHSAMPAITASKKCPHAIFVPPRIWHYKTVSDEIMEILKQYSDAIEPLSLDEAFIDVTINKKNQESATIIAREIKKEIKQKTGLTASAGVSYCKFLAKIASDYKKPDGLFVIKPDEALEFIGQLPIEKFFGIGKATAARMHALEIFTGKDLQNKDELFLIQHFGKSGSFFYHISRGIDNRSVDTSSERKSVGAEETFMDDISGKDEIIRNLDSIIETLFRRLQRANLFGKTLTLKIKYEDFIQNTRSVTSPHTIADIPSIKKIAYTIIQNEELRDKKIRLLGLSVSNFKSESLQKRPTQLSLQFPETD